MAAIPELLRDMASRSLQALRYFRQGRVIDLARCAGRPDGSPDHALPAEDRCRHTPHARAVLLVIDGIPLGANLR